MERSCEISIDPDLSSSYSLGVKVELISWRGWSDCYRLTNGLVEAILVPAIGRVMHFGLAGDSEGVFWQNRDLDGQVHDPKSSEWQNFGGDKSWPAPQSGWPEAMGRAWPPPQAFDSSPVEVVVTELGLVVTSPVDRNYGIQVVRRVELQRGKPEMCIQTEYHMLAGRPVTVSIWIITQMREPERVFLQRTEKSRSATGYLRLLDAEPEQLKIADGLLSFARHPNAYVKVGSDGSTMVWVGKDTTVSIRMEDESGVFPDGGCVTEIYTNPDPLRYVELETLGPLVTMTIGDRSSQTTHYRITPRTLEDAEEEARLALG